MYTTYIPVNYTTIVMLRGAAYLIKRGVGVSIITTSTTIIVGIINATIITIATYSWVKPLSC